MRVQAQILATALLAGVAVAQTAPASQTVKQNPPPSQAQKVSGAGKAAKNPFVPKAKNLQAAAQTGAPAKPAAHTVAAPKPVASVAAKAVPKPAKPAEMKTKPAEVKKEATPEVAQSLPRKLPSPGKRDPFVSPIAAAASRGPGTSCSTGKRCLVVDQIVLKGIVQMKTGNFALVENIARRPYVLHENDSLFNGSVVKITGDSVVFKEDSSDILGRPISREVIKKVSAPAV